jgi:hypothetical protein
MRKHCDGDVSYRGPVVFAQRFVGTEAIYTPVVVRIDGLTVFPPVEVGLIRRAE